MAKKSIYLPFYEGGAWHWIEVTGTVHDGPVPEGLPAINSRSAWLTPPKRLQPHNQHE